MKLWMNRVLDFLLWLAFCLMLATGFILRFRLPPGSQGGRGLAVLGLDRHDWGDLHTWLGYAVCVMVVTHLALHWCWLWRCAVPRWKWPVIVGLLAGILLAVSAWVLPVERSDEGDRGGPGRGMGRGQGAGWRSDR